MKRTIYIIFAAMVACIQAQATENRLSFNHLDLENGLSSVSTNDVWPDPSGVIWIATNVGLDCYDGNNVIPICPPQELHNSSQDMFTRQLAGSDDGHLYVLYASNISVLDTHTYAFRVIFNGVCNCIEYRNGIWAGHGGTIIHAACPDSGFLTEFTVSPEDGDVTAISHIDDNTIMFGTSKGKIFRLEKDTEGWKSETVCGNTGSEVTRIYIDSRNTIWAGTFNDGIFAMAKDGKLTRYTCDSGNGETISSNYIRDFCEDNLGNIWIGTYTGLDSINPDTGEIITYHHDIMRQDALSHSSVWGIKKDRQGTLWIATYYGGINYFNPEYNIYTRYSVSTTEGEGLSSPIVSKVLTDRKGNIWIATEGGGLNMIDRQSGRTTWYNTGARAGHRLSENNIKDMIYVPGEDAVYVGLHLGGINRIDLKTGKIRTYRADAGSSDGLPSDDILAIADSGDSLIVRMKAHACIMDKESGKCRMLRTVCDYLNGYGNTRIFFVDSSKNIWMSKKNSGKLIRLAPPYTSEKVYTRENTGGDFCTSDIAGLMQDPSGKVWIASASDGFYVYNYADDTFTSIGGEISIKGSCHMAESPSSGKIICSSDNGFITFNPVTHKVRRYGKEKGFPLRISQTQCIAITDDSEIFIGGYGGLVSVSEKELETTRQPYRLFFTSLTVDSKKVGTGSRILPESILNTPSVTLPSGTRSIELYFSSSNHISANTDPVEYRLEGFDKDWNPVKGERKISYTNLPPGKYRLCLRPSADVPEEICPGTALDITIRAPWYASWPTVCIYVLLASALILVVINFYKSKVQSREKEVLNQEKLRFFTNVSHEIRTPLTIIIAGIESIIQQHNLSPALYKKILGIYKNSLSLRELVSELLEFRKQEQGQMNIKVAPHNLVFFINEFCLLFSEYAESKGIELKLTTDTERLEVWYDQIQMQKVLNNILANAIKFTPKGGTVTIRVYSTAASAVIDITDTGCGIPEKDLKKIFDRFYQVEYSSDMNTGTGIGLALAQGIVRMHSGNIEAKSTEGNGSMFRITLPLGYSHFTHEQMSDSTDKPQTMTISDKITVPSVRPPQDAEETGTVQNEYTILIAEDNPGVLDMLVELFSPFYKVVTATDGTSALEKVRKYHPSLVLSDVLMPGISGTKLCRIIKNDPALCQIPVVLLTARVEVEQNIEGLQQGADDYITKPFNSTLLLSRCNNLVNSRIMLQEKFSRSQSNSTWTNAVNRMDNEFLQKVTETITANLDSTSFDISELIKTVGMSRTSFFRKLKTVTGQTPSEFVLTIRLKKGAELLRFNPEMNINEISDAIGFNTPKYFAKCFKDHYGKSPFAWRKDITESQSKDRQ